MVCKKLFIEANRISAVYICAREKNKKKVKFRDQTIVEFVKHYVEID